MCPPAVLYDQAEGLEQKSVSRRDGKSSSSLSPNSWSPTFPTALFALTHRNDAESSLCSSDDTNLFCLNFCYVPRSGSPLHGHFSIPNLHRSQRGSKSLGRQHNRPRVSFKQTAVELSKVEPSHGVQTLGPCNPKNATDAQSHAGQRDGALLQRKGEGTDPIPSIWTPPRC